VLTASGRETTPFPKVSLDTNRRAIKTLRTVDQWIMHNALAEAEARGDDFNARQFRANQDRPSQSDKDSAEEYLFGEAPTTAKEPQRSLSAAEELAQGNLFAEPAKTPSWVIQNKETGEVIAETYDPKKVAALNKEKYKATPILEYLQNLNRKIKEEAPTTAPAQGVSYPSVEDIHAAADAKHIAWDGDVTFEKMTEQVTGKKHLDSLTGAERQAVLERVQKMAERPSAQQMEQRHQLQLQKRIGVLQSLLNCLGA